MNYSLFLPTILAVMLLYIFNVSTDVDIYICIIYTPVLYLEPGVSMDPVGRGLLL